MITCPILTHMTDKPEKLKFDAVLPKSAKRPGDYLQNSNDRAQKAHIRWDTIKRFVPFMIGCTNIVIEKDDILMKQNQLAEKLKLSVFVLNNNWRAHCVKIYGEPRRWPGPETKWFKRYAIYRPDTGETYRDLKRKAMKRHDEALEEDPTSDCANL